MKINLANLQKEIGDEYVILLRMHYLIANALDLHGYDDFAIDVSNYNDISEYLISDALITDYSSVMFDFWYLEGPQFFLFAYDIENMIKDFVVSTWIT